MIYRFVMVSDEVDDFKRVIAIDSEDTFMSLRNAVLDSVGYTHDQMDSFLICESDWSARAEVTLTDMGSDSISDVWIMADTKIEELVEEEGQRLRFVFDALADRSFFMELKQVKYSATLDEPVVEKSVGDAPRQTTDIDELLAAPTPAGKGGGTEFDADADFYGDDSYSDDELDAEGYVDLESLDM